jgi:hypothetical protein
MAEDHFKSSIEFSENKDIQIEMQDGEMFESILRKPKIPPVKLLSSMVMKYNKQTPFGMQIGG